MQTEINTEPRQSIPRRENVWGITSLIAFGIFCIIIAIFKLDKGPGGWAWGYGIQYLILGWIIVLIGCLLSAIGILKSSKRWIPILGLFFNGFSLLMLIPIAPLATQVIGQFFSSGSPSATDRAWYLMETNRDSIINSLPDEKKEKNLNNYHFLEGINSQLKKSDGREIEKIIVQYKKEEGILPNHIRSQKAIDSLNKISEKYENLRPRYNESFGGQRK